MFLEERHRNILELLNKDGKVFVKDLSKKFNVCESMIRKDLNVLEKQNLLKRTYGGAISVRHTIINKDSLITRINKESDSKRIIAEKAVEKIIEGDTVFLDASSTSYKIAELLIEKNMNITIITNMLEISSLIQVETKIQFIFIGGDFNIFCGGSVGSYAINMIKMYRCTKAFIGCTGINLNDGGVSVTVSEDAATKEEIMKISQKVYLIASNSKFDMDGTFNFANISEFQGIFTECRPDEFIVNKLEQYSVDII